MLLNSTARRRVLFGLRRVCFSRLTSLILAALLATSIGVSLLRADLSFLVVAPQTVWTCQSTPPEPTVRRSAMPICPVPSPSTRGEK